MPYRIAILALLLPLVPAANATPRPANGIKGFTAPSKALRLAFTITGIVDTVDVKRGDYVKHGDILLTVEAREQLAEVNKLKGRLQTVDLEIEAAEKSMELAKAEYDMNIELREKGAGSHIELQRSRIQYELSQIEFALRTKNRESIVLELKQNESILDRYTLRAPVDGWIEEVANSEGEIVERTRPVVALMVTDPLKIDLQVAVSQALNLKVGDPVWVHLDIAGHDGTLEGKITFKAKVADAASDTQTVGIELGNPRGLDAGMDVVVDFTGPEAETSSP